MENDTIRFVNLEKHDTKDINDGHINGSLTVIWRDWDKILDVEPKMVYVSSVNSGEIKDLIYTLLEIVILFVLEEKLFLLQKILMDNIMK